MNGDLHAKLLTALRLSLRPLTRLLLRHGITYGQFADVAKEAFVAEALSERDQRGRQTNKARIAVRTGLSRKEVTRIRDRLHELDASKGGSDGLVMKVGSAARALQLWHVDERFLGEDGQPRTLVFSGGDLSFSGLARLVGGDIPPGALRAELVDARAVAELPNGALKPLRRHFIPVDVGDELLVGLTHIVVPVIEGLAHNAGTTNTDPFFQRVAYSDRLTEPATGLFREKAQEDAALFLQSIDNWLSANESRGQLDGDHPRRVGVGIFYFEGDAPRVAETPQEL